MRDIASRVLSPRYARRLLPRWRGQTSPIRAGPAGTSWGIWPACSRNPTSARPPTWWRTPPHWNTRWWSWPVGGGKWAGSPSSPPRPGNTDVGEKPKTGGGSRSRDSRGGSDGAVPSPTCWGWWWCPTRSRQTWTAQSSSSCIPCRTLCSCRWRWCCPSGCVFWID